MICHFAIWSLSLLSWFLAETLLHILSCCGAHISIQSASFLFHSDHLKLASLWLATSFISFSNSWGKQLLIDTLPRLYICLIFWPELEDIVSRSLFLILNDHPQVAYFDTSRRRVCTWAMLVRICHCQYMTSVSKVKQACVFTLLWACKIVSTLYLWLHFMCWNRALR